MKKHFDLRGAHALLLTALVALLGLQPLRAQEGGAQEPPAEGQGAQPAEDEAEADGELVALQGGDVYTVTQGVLRGATVLIRGKKISRIGHGFALPAGTKVYDVSGLRVYPGLVALDSRGLLGSAGKIEDTADPFNYQMTLALSAGVTSARQGNAVVKLTRGDLEGMVLRDNVGVSLTSGSNSYGSGFQQRESVRAALRKAASYIKAFDEWADRQAKKINEKDKPPSSAGVNKDFVKLLRHQEQAFANVEDAANLRAYAQLAQEFGFHLVIEGCSEGWTLADELGRAGVTAVVTPRNTFREPSEELLRPNGYSIENAGKLYRAGVDICVAPLSGGIGLGGIAGRDLLNLTMEAAFAIRGGLPADAALEAMTIGAARLLGVDERVGSLERGKDADVIVLDGDLFDYRSFVQYAFVDGKLRYEKNAETFFSHIRPVERPAPSVVEAKQ
jgi:imidazolonepropionase-like amidohydrolase